MQPEAVDSGTPDPVDPPVLFYTSIKRLFRSNFIGYLHQLCLHRRVVLLTEDLDEETNRLLADHALFPGLVRQIRIGQYDVTSEGIFARHRRMSRRAREIVDELRPKVIFSPGGDAFEHYLRRHARRKCGAINIFCPSILLVRRIREAVLLFELQGAETRFPGWLPRGVRRALARTRRNLAQFVYYYLAPLAVGEHPLHAVNGIYQIDDARLANMDISCVFTLDNKDLLVRAGAPADRVRVIPHPMKPGVADPLWRALGVLPQAVRERPQVVTCFLLIDRDLAFRRDDLSQISDTAVFASRTEVVKTLLTALPGWEIRIKSHPMSEASPIYASVRVRLTKLSERVVWVPPDDPADPHLMASGAVVVFPPTSAVVFSAIIQCPGVPTLIVDVLGELRGDPCVGMAGVATITSLLELNGRLATIAAGTWAEGPYRHDAGDFETMDELVAAMLPFHSASPR